MINNIGSTLTLDGSISAASIATALMNTGACNVLEINGPTDFAGGLTNSGIIVSTAPEGTVTASGGAGTIVNTGIIIDPNNSLGSTLTPSASRAAGAAVDNTGGVIIAPYSEACYIDCLLYTSPSPRD